MQTVLFVGMVNSVVVFIVACLLAFLLWRTNRKLERLLAVVALVMATLACWGLSVSVIPPLIAEMTTAQPLAVPSGLTDTPRPPVTEMPTATPVSIASAPTEFRYPAPGLVGPDDGSEFKGDETVLLIWDTPVPLSEDEWYEVQLWREGDVPYTVVQRTREGTWKVEHQYYPGRYQWRILVVRSQEGQKEVLSPPSQTRSFSWLSPVVQPPTPPTSPSLSEAPVDLTIYLRGTNNAQGFATFSGEQVNAGTIYTERGYVYGNVAVRIGDAVYRFDESKPAPGEPEQLPDPWRVEFEFAETLVARTGNQAGFDPKKAQFWVGALNCDSATQDKPYKIEMTLYAGGEARKHTEVSFLVADDPFCGDGCIEPETYPTCCPCRRP